MIKRNIIMILLLLFAIQINTEAIDLQESEDSQISVLIDASYDGGVWWYPLASPYNSSEYHQGTEFVNHIKTQFGEDIMVKEVNRDESILDQNFSNYDIVIVIDRGSHSLSEYQYYIDNYENSNIQSILILSSPFRNENSSPLRNHFGFTLGGISVGSNMIDRFADHPVTINVTAINYGLGSGILSYPENTTLIGWLDNDTYVDLNDNNVKDDAEEYGMPVIAIIEGTHQKMGIIGSIRTLQLTPEPLTSNLLNWIKDVSKINTDTTNSEIISTEITSDTSTNLLPIRFTDIITSFSLIFILSREKNRNLKG